MEKLNHELLKLCEAIENAVVRKPVKMLALDKLGRLVTGKEKPSRETLDRLSLLAGFQDWESFSNALHGDADAAANYGQEQGGKRGRRQEKIKRRQQQRSPRAYLHPVPHAR